MIKTFEKFLLKEEYFWESRDNDIANIIIKRLNNINGEEVAKINGVFGHGASQIYEYTIKKDKNEVDPYGEEIWENDVKIEASQFIGMRDEVGNLSPIPIYKVIVHTSNRTIKLKTNKAIKIFGILKKAYKQNLRNAERTALRSAFESHDNIDPYNEERWGDDNGDVVNYNGNVIEFINTISEIDPDSYREVKELLDDMLSSDDLDERMDLADSIIDHFLFGYLDIYPQLKDDIKDLTLRGSGYRTPAPRGRKRFICNWFGTAKLGKHLI